MSAGARQVQHYAVIAGVARTPPDLRQPQPVTVEGHHGFRVAGLARNPYLERRSCDERRRPGALTEGQAEHHGVPQRNVVDHEIGRVAAGRGEGVRFDRDTAESELLVEAQVASVGCRGTHDQLVPAVAATDVARVVDEGAAHAAPPELRCDGQILDLPGGAVARDELQMPNDAPLRRLSNEELPVVDV